MPFPLATLPQQRWHGNGLAFGAARDNGRLHAGCDLLSPARSPVYAIDDGVVFHIDRGFTRGRNGSLDAIAIRHRAGFVARYCELVSGTTGALKPGDAITQGQILGQSGELMTRINDMIHFELYEGTQSGVLSVRGANAYNRRRDLLDPTRFLDRLTTLLNRQHGPISLQSDELVRAA